MPDAWKTGYTCLNEKHEVTLASGINKVKLAFHLVIDHGTHVNDNATKAELGRQHMMIHALMGNPQTAASFGVEFKGAFMVKKGSDA